MSIAEQTISVSQRARLETLVGSWQLRARANLKGSDAVVLRDNVAALQAALSTVDFASRFRDGWLKERDRNEKAALIIDEVKAALDDFARFRGPRPKRVDMAALSDRIQAAIETLEY
jgi:hypothetical protein